MKNTLALAAILLLASPIAARAETVDGVSRLSASEAEAIKEAAAQRHLEHPASTQTGTPPASIDLTTLTTSPADAPTPKGRYGNIHGEVGFGIGTGGYSEVFGTAVIPIGQTGVVALSFANSQFGRGRR